MLGKSKANVEEKDDHHEDKSEVLGNLVKVVVLDPTFIASVFSGSLAAFGLSPAKTGGGTNGNAKAPAKKEPEVVSAVEPKDKKE
jgi:hypothetical protein